MRRPIAVGVDAAELLRDERGIGRYVRGVLRSWHAHHADRVAPTLLVPQWFPRLIEPALARRLGGARLPVRRRTVASREDGPFDVVWYPWNGMTWVAAAPSVVTLHDVWPFVAPASSAQRREREQRHYQLAALRAARFIAVSQFTKTEAVKHLAIDGSRVDVVPNGFSPLTSRPPRPATVDGAERFVLFVGEAEPRKDLSTLVAAMARLPDALGAATALVVAGRSGRDPVPTAAGVRVEVEGRVSDERLASLYAGAAAFVFPSRYEGFGLPVLEAMAYGAPVVAADAASIREAGGDAAVYFAPGDADACAAQLARVLDDKTFASALASAGRQRAAIMTQDACAERTLEVLERVAAR